MVGIDGKVSLKPKLKETHPDPSRFVVFNVELKREQFICPFVYKFLSPPPLLLW